ncbi:AAA family ATPase [Ancylomarina sp. DW003]|nr:AAA family ATPase [Ancylomarina sp. DW003]MDE5422120.1 AAA family ATPase [Ancylomarina sp. DW003]
MINIRAIKIEINTNSGLYGAEYSFEKGFNIIRGNNTSGKSSLFQSILYCLGFEELIGGKNEKTMQSVLKDIVEFPKGSFHQVLQSFVFLEFENGNNKIVTSKRSVKCESRASQLIDVFKGALLTGENKALDSQPMYIHDKGGASDDIYGYHLFLEHFLGWSLPSVLNKSGDKRKIYLQQVAPSFIIEQKTGWSGFLATMPFYGLTNKEARIIEFVLGLDVYVNKQEKLKLNTAKRVLEEKWTNLFKQLTRFAEKGGGKLYGFDSKPTIVNDTNSISILLIKDEEQYSIPDFIDLQAKELELVEHVIIPKVSEKVEQNEAKLDSLNESINANSLNYEMLSEELSFDKDKLIRYKVQLQSLQEDLRKNKGAQKVKKLGAEIDSKIAQDICPTCEQTVKDSLLPSEITQTPMLIEDNIAFIDAQIKMIKVYIEGLESKIRTKEIRLDRIKLDLSNKRQQLRDIKRELISDDRLPSEVEIERKLNIKKRIEFYTKYLEDFNEYIEEVEYLSSEHQNILNDTENLPSDYFSTNDRKKLRYLLAEFKRLIGKFEYTSKSNDLINISMDNYLPVAQTQFGDDLKSYDLRFDSGASDFIRCIWAYTCSLYLTSQEFECNHPNLLMFDEPKQQDISINHFRSFLTELSGYTGVQTLLFASFENSDESFKNATEGLDFNLRYIDKKLIKPLTIDE